jgi:hypothetical protein
MLIGRSIERRIVVAALGHDEPGWPQGSRRQSPDDGQTSGDEHDWLSVHR